MLAYKYHIEKILIILCTYILITFLCVIKVNAYVDTTLIIDIKDYSSNENESQYKIIDNKGMNDFSALVNSGIKFTGKTIYLANDIEFESNIENNFIPVGTYDKIAFEGTFDGQGYAIRGININKPNELYQAVFSYTKSSTTIKNLGVIDSNINGSMAVAAISAMNINGVIENCYSNVTVTCNQMLGGIVGNNTGKIINCTNYGSISGNSMLLGGICGRNTGSISMCCNRGKLIAGDNTNDIGGICAENSLDINNCYNTGAIIGNNKSNTGGICGSTYVDLAPSNISNTYNIGTITGEKYVGGIVGVNRYFNSSTSISNNYYLVDSAFSGIGRDDSGNIQAVSETSENMKTDEFSDVLNGGSDIWIRNDDINDGYPALKSGNDTMYKLDIVNDSDDGTISYNGDIYDKVYVEAGTRINLEVAPHSDYLLSDLIINDISTHNTTGEFIMPSKDSKVSPIFSEVSEDNITDTPNDEILGSGDNVDDTPNDDILDLDDNDNLGTGIVDPTPDIDEDINEVEYLKDNDIDNNEKDPVINRIYNNIFNTGDNKNVIYLISISIISLIIIILMIILRRKRKM